MKFPDIYMQRCLQLATIGASDVSPNPMVGAVVVAKDRIIGEGYHKKFGDHHAEVNAIHAVEDKLQLRGATLFVNLEPCSHYGKTPPCTDLIIASGIKRVYIGMEDPFASVSGSGIRKLRDAGIEVICNLMESDCRYLNRRFVCTHTKERPYLILKWAQSRNGIMGSETERLHISNSMSKMFTHKWRSEEKGILIGAKTALQDNPQLNTRFWKGPSPIRILSDRSGSLCENSSLHIFDGKQQTLVFTQQENLNYPNAEVICLASATDFLPSMLGYLKGRGLLSILVEGGSFTLQEFINLQLWDECRIFVAGSDISSGIFAPAFPKGRMNVSALGNNTLFEIFNSQSA